MKKIYFHVWRNNKGFGCHLKSRNGKIIAADETFASKSGVKKKYTLWQSLFDSSKVSLSLTEDADRLVGDIVL